MTIVEDTRVITGGVDTHAGMHVAAALDPLGGLLGCGSSRRPRPGTPSCSPRLYGHQWPASELFSGRTTPQCSNRYAGADSCWDLTTSRQAKRLPRRLSRLPAAALGVVCLGVCRLPGAAISVPSGHVAAMRGVTGEPARQRKDPACAVTCDGALTAAWTRWPPAVRTWSSTSGGCKRPAGSSPPPSPGGSRWPPGSTAPASSTPCWSTPRPSMSAGRMSRPNHPHLDSPICSSRRC